MVLYADWVPATYDIGIYNAQTANTTSTNHIITTHVFDYNYLFNVMSSTANVKVDKNSHSETWSHITNGTVTYQGAQTLDFIFKDNDSGGKLSLANNRSYNNDYHDATTVSSGIYTPQLGEILFGTDNGYDPETGEGIIGKTYLGQGDYLFQYMSDTDSEYYGYYYFDSKLNAVSYNQSEERFYVYDYLARSSDSSGQSGVDQYSDFLPLNSPYANTNGNNTGYYTYDGINGEYNGINHLEYDVNASNNDRIATNMAFGMSMEMKFYIPDVPGSRDDNGEFGNRDLYGNEMIYTFSGDDDVWVLVDGEVVLDIGGIHQIVSGTINFSTGIVTVNGSQQDTIYDLSAGDHILTVYYLERGSSQSNCAMYFNLAPRYSLTIQKEDVLTQELLDGAEFSVYMDEECFVPAVLWESEYAYDRNEPPTNTFTVDEGYADLWGMSPGKTYYIKETNPPDGYDLALGTIRFELDMKGTATFEIEIVDDGDGISPGYTVHGYHINTESQAAYITVTNAQSWVDETITVQIAKRWEDGLNHSGDYVAVYLTVTDNNGTVRRIREAILGDENNWSYTWTNLPKYASDGETEVAYGAEESYTPGYSSTVERVDKLVETNEVWESFAFVNDQEYLLKTADGKYLSQKAAGSQDFTLVDETTAKQSYGAANSLSTWKATVSGSNVKLTNKAGGTISYNTSNNSRYFFVTKSQTDKQTFIASETSSGYTLRIDESSWWWTTSYYMGSMNNSGYLSSTTDSGSALELTPMIAKFTSTETEVDGIAYRITNIPLEAETSLTVTKYWDTGLAVNVPYETSQVTIRLYANGKDTGRSVTLNLKNNWTAAFRGLPYTDEQGNVIVYSVVETWDNDDWEPIYGEVIASADAIPTYQTTVTNNYRYGHGYELPSTGGFGSEVWVLSGMGLMAFSLVSGYILHFKGRRRDTK